jgi:hypothetical protein
VWYVCVCVHVCGMCICVCICVCMCVYICTWEIVVLPDQHPDLVPMKALFMPIHTHEHMCVYIACVYVRINSSPRSTPGLLFVYDAHLLRCKFLSCVCVCACMYVRVHVGRHVHSYHIPQATFIDCASMDDTPCSCNYCPCVCMYTCMRVCMYECMYVHACVYVCVHEYHALTPKQSKTGIFEAAAQYAVCKNIIPLAKILM